LNFQPRKVFSDERVKRHILLLSGSCQRKRLWLTELWKMLYSTTCLDMNNETLFRQWLESNIEYLTWSNNNASEEGAKFLQDPKRIYDAGLAYGMAISDRIMLRDLLNLKAKLDENK